MFLQHSCYLLRNQLAQNGAEMKKKVQMSLYRLPLNEDNRSNGCVPIVLQIGDLTKFQ